MIRHGQFAGIIKGFFPNGVPPALIALSGGVDSMCLTYLLARHRKLYQPDLKLHAVTIDHGYRKNSNIEAENVGKIVSQWGVDHSVCKLDSSILEATNFEEAARDARYAVFDEKSKSLQLEHIFLAHNRNEQLETYLYRLIGNSSIRGLCGLKPLGYLPFSCLRSPSDKPRMLVRPLLDFDKKDIINTCKSNEVEWFEDPTNKDITLTPRNKLRFLIEEYLPKLHENDRDAYQKYSNITKESILKTYDKVVALNSSITAQARYLQLVLLQDKKLLRDANAGRVQFVFTFDEWEFYSCQVLSRLLYCNLQSISPTKHFHYSYTKLERKCVPQFQDFYRKVLNAKGSIHLQKNSLTYMSLKFDFAVDVVTRLITMDVGRQNIKKTIPEDFTHSGLSGEDKSMFRRLNSVEDFDKWWLWDSRYWIRVHGLDDNSEHVLQTVDIVPYFHSLHHKYLKYYLIDYKALHINNIPFVIATIKNKSSNVTETHISLPTRGVSTFGGLKVDSVLKMNLTTLEGERE